MNLMRKTLLLALFLCLTAFTVACGDDGGDGQVDAQALYESETSPTCASCHGIEGGGEAETQFPAATDFTSYTGDAATIEDAIRNGRADLGMAAYTNLSDSEVAALVAYVQAFQQ